MNTTYCDNRAWLDANYLALENKYGFFHEGLFTDMFDDGQEWAVLIQFEQCWVVGLVGSLRPFWPVIETQDQEIARARYLQLITQPPEEELSFAEPNEVEQDSSLAEPMFRKLSCA